MNVAGRPRPAWGLLGLLLLPGAASPALEVGGLRCEYAARPLAVETPHPRLSWLSTSDRRGARQAAWQVLVASSPELLARDRGDRWDSGRVATDQSIQVAYAGAPLASEADCWWQVRVWDERGKRSAWSPPARWRMGLLQAADWQAAWIGWTPPAGAALRPPGDPSPWLRKVVDLPAAPAEAFVHVNAAGYYELYVNGTKVGDDVLSPAVSDLRHRSLYRTYDLAPCLKQGRNCIALWLGRGWFDPGRAHTAPGHGRPVGPCVRLQGTLVTARARVPLRTDATWKAAPSPYATPGPWNWNNFGGERYDARQAHPRWSLPDFDDRAWDPAQVVPAPAPCAVAQTCPPNRIGQRLAARRVTELGGGRYELDFGTNLTGWLRLKLPALQAGDRVTLFYADKRFASDGPENTPAGVIKGTGSDRTFAGPRGKVRYQVFNQSDEFTSAGGAREEFCSKFNYHGFRYVILEGLPAPPRPADAEALLIDSDLEEVGAFACSSELFNRLHRLNCWAVRCLDLGGYLVDCPTRERMGYGDGQVSAETCLMNFGMPAFYTQWLEDWRLMQNPGTGELPHVAPWGGGGGGPGWGGLFAALTWRMYLYQGDRRLLETNYPAMRRYVDFLEGRCQNNVLRAYGNQWDFLGDWVPPGRGMDTHNWPPRPAEELFNNCYRVYLWDLLRQSAAALGRADEVQRCQAALNRIRPAVHQAFYDPAKQCYVLDEQAYYLMPLLTGVTPPELRDAVFKKLEERIRVGCRGHLDTGMLGTYFLIRYLQDGHNDLLNLIVSQETYPGWGYMLSQGATTIWEQWNGYWSQIHSCFTSLDGWFYEGLAGIRPDPAGPGFKQIIIRPAILALSKVEEPALSGVEGPALSKVEGPAGLTWVRAHHDSPYGRISSAWRRDGRKLAMDITLPANTTATVVVPAATPDDVRESGRPAGEAAGVQRLRDEPHAAVFAVGAGTYRFTSTLP